MEELKAHSTKPPKAADHFLSWFCKDELLEEVKGDLHEFYLEERQVKGKWRASWAYWFHVLHFLRPFAIKRKTQQTTQTVMYKNYLIVALRNFKRHKFYSFLNLLGLSAGIASCLLIFLFVRDERSFDRHHQNYANIYRVVTDFQLGDRTILQPRAPVVMAEHLMQTVPEVLNAGRVMSGMFDTVVELGEKQVHIDNATYATTEMLEIFTIPFVAGSAENALDNPNDLVISESMAELLFPGEDAVGKSAEFNMADFIVKGVFKDMPDNSHFKFDFMMPVAYQTSRFEMNWMDINSFTYLHLAEGADVTAVENKMNEAVQLLMAPFIEQAFKIPATDIQSAGNHARFHLQPLADIHLKSDMDREIRPNGSIATVRTISFIGLIILVIACINFVNLSTARAAIRGKEVGVRKVLGSRRKQLISQFLFESTLHSFFSFVLAAIIMNAALPYFNALTDKEITAPFGGNPPLWLLMIVGAFALGVIAGLYPAFVLSSFTPEKTLKGQDRASGRGSWLRNGLVVVQFSISTVLVIAALVVNRQLTYMTEKSLGYDKDKLITIDVMDLNRLNRGDKVLKNELLKRPNIKSFSRTGYVPVGGARLEMFLERKERTAIDESINAQAWGVTEDYIPTLGIDVLQGSNFNDKIISDSVPNIILNQTAARRLQLTDPIGAQLTMRYGEQSWNVNVIGVLRDFHYASMKENIQPLFLYRNPDPWRISVRFSGPASEALMAIEEEWMDHAGGQPLTARVVSEEYKNLYDTENKMKMLVNGFSLLAIVVAALGLFGLATFVAEQRKKEMGIRRVLGAPSWNLVINLVRKFTVLVVISCAIAIPLGYFLTRNWLGEFAYRITLSPHFFIGASLGMIILAWLTVSYQSVKVARQNPIDSLRYE